MSARAETLLTVIAIATLLMAIAQVGVLVATGLLARRLQRLVERAERDLTPLFDHLNAIGRDVSRATSLAALQVDRADRLFADLADRVDSTLNALQNAVTGPVREGAAMMAAFRAVINALKDVKGRSRSRAEDEDALFI